MKLAVLLPCKMSSRRIPRKNLATVGWRSLLDLGIDRFQAWFPEATIHVATEDTEAAAIAMSRGCKIYPLTADDVQDRRNGSELFNAWLAGRKSDERCILYQLSSPFTFRSELVRAVNDPRPFCCAAWEGTLHLAGGDDWTPLSQTIPPTTCLAGNFYATWGGHVVTPREENTQFVTVSWLSAIQIDTPEDLRLADHIARRMTLRDFNDLEKR